MSKKFGKFRPDLKNNHLDNSGRSTQTMTNRKPSPSVGQQARLHPAMSPPADISQLQRTLGNRTVSKMMTAKDAPPSNLQNTVSRRSSGFPVQRKLTVGPANDKYEQEADSVAKQVVRQISSPAAKPVQRQPVEDEEAPVQGKFVRLRSELEEEELMQGRFLQRQPEEEELLQGKFETGRIQRQEDEEELMAKPASRGAGREGGNVEPDVEASIQKARGGGQPIPGRVRGNMEQAFGTDFSNVRLHMDSRSNELNHTLQARAFTTGQNIFFREGEYNPDSSRGKEILAHELTHVIQQSGGNPKISRWGGPGGKTSHTEVTADAFKKLRDNHPEFELWYSTEAQHHLAKGAEDMDLRFGFLAGSWAKGALVIGPSYQLWSKMKRKGRSLARTARKAGRGLRRGIGWLGEKLGITEEQHQAAKSKSKIGRGGVKKSMWRGLRRGAGWLGAKLGFTEDQWRDAEARDTFKFVMDFERQAAYEYDNLRGYWRSSSEAPNHAESGMYNKFGGANETDKRLEEYLESAKEAYDKGDTTQALQILGFALHTAEDRGAHYDGEPGTGHDPRRVHEPPVLAKTGRYYNPDLNKDGGDCDRKAKNPLGYTASVRYAMGLLKRFVSKLIGTATSAKAAMERGGRLAGYKRPGGFKRFLRKAAAFFGKDIIRFGSEAKGIKE